MKYVFIDSNIWLSLYHFSSDDLEQFSKLKALIGLDFQLLIPEQVRNEVRRNRDAKLKDALAKFERLDLTFPAFCKSYNEYKDISEKFRELKNLHQKWLEKIKQDIAGETLLADTVINELFSQCEVLDVPENIIKRAELRYKSGNPPGKDNSLGDAINWETLIENVPDGEELYFISADKDYASVIDVNRFNLFLEKEWKEKKKSNIEFFKSLVSFMNAHVKDIKLQTEQKKEEIINRLRHSGSFQRTHTLIAELSQYDDWNSDQIDQLCEIAMSNSQISWILDDDDVYDFYKGLVTMTKSASDSISAVKIELQKIADNENLDS